MILEHSLSAVVAFVSVGLKGFQHKNVIHNKRLAIFVTSYFMAVADVLTVGLVVKNGWPVAFAVGTGAAFGMLVATALHDKLLGTKTK